ncbi:MAG: GGDEF domain-containing protein [Mycobacterium sp.]|mgnify:CR=1 FL=1|nr:GGDEF domain-containing protein [Mycobacterium sp.]
MSVTPDVSLRRWWNDPGEYGWLVAFLEARGLSTAMKRIVAVIGAVLAALAAVMQLGPRVNEDPLSRILLVVVVLFGTAWAIRWWRWDWPRSVRASMLLLAAGDIGIALAALVNSDPLAGLAGTPLFAMMGAYITFFHTPKVHALHIALLTATIAVLSAWLAVQQGHGGGWFAASKGGIALVVSIGLLPLLHYGFWIMQRSFVDSLTDPLTGLANRRGLEEALRSLRTDVDPEHLLTAVWVDLDGFKSINDKHGHLAGDAVLIRTARCIQDCVPPRAVVARLGGEEFLVMVALSRAEAASVAERIRRAIATPTHPGVTASIGVATAEPGTDGHFDVLLKCADDAMYEAKRLGGDQVVQAA